MQVAGSSKKMDRPKTIWMEIARIDLKKCNQSEDLAQDRLEFNKIHAPDPQHSRDKISITSRERQNQEVY